MHSIGDRKFLEIPGDKIYELPPLIAQRRIHPAGLINITSDAEEIAESDTMDLDQITGLENEDLHARRIQLAIALVNAYRNMLTHWRWGDHVLEWTWQCRYQFEYGLNLGHLLQPDVWPRASLASFVELLNDKDMTDKDVNLKNAVGLRLTFRQPPPISSCTEQFLLYLHANVSASAYETWADKNPSPVYALPPERFSVQVLSL